MYFTGRLCSSRRSISLQYIIRPSPATKRPRVECCNAETYRYFWPFVFARHVPAALYLCRWVASGGAGVCGALRLKMKPSGECYLTVARRIRKGTALISVPRNLVIEAPLFEDERFASTLSRTTQGWSTIVGTMTQELVRHLHNPKSPFKYYVEFLHDLHNVDQEENSFNELDPQKRLLKHQLYYFYAGNVLNAKGVPNAPFLEKEQLRTTQMRLQWWRLHAQLRQVQQGVPHFAAPSVPWAMSMVLSRAITSRSRGGCLGMVPLIDFADHSYVPNALVKLTSGSTYERDTCGVRWHDPAVPSIHLIAAKEIEKGSPVTVLYSSRGTETEEDKDFWQLHWGFVPSKQK